MEKTKEKVEEIEEKIEGCRNGGIEWREAGISKNCHFLLKLI